MANTSVVGLDIGSSQIKAVHVERRRNLWSLAHVGIVPTPPDSVQDGVILDIPRVTEAVRQLMRDHQIPPTDCIAAVTGSQVLVRSIRIPDMKQAALPRSIRFEAAKHIDQGATGATIDNSVVEYEVRGKLGEVPNQQLDVLMVIAPLPMVNSRVAVMEGAGLEPVAVDVEAFAVMRAVHAVGIVPGPNQAVVVCNMGATYTDVNIILENEVAVTRSIPLGGNSLTLSLASMLNCPPEDAEAQKKFVDVSPGQDTDAIVMGMAVQNPTRQVAVPFVDELIRELRRSVIYFQSQAAEAGVQVAVEHLLLTGGGAELIGLGAYLRERLGMDVRVLDLLGIHSESPASQEWDGRGAELAVAIGLALKEYV